ncbi:MAG: hypothetical protein O3A51_10925 [Verrucomicrobia bacterium]|nr:hypothetical protein [Verrucomicrobiota bacterium]
MKVFHRLVGIVLFVLLAAVCVWVIRQAVHGHWAEGVATITSVDPWMGCWSAVGLLSLAGLYVLTGIQKPTGRKLLSFDNEGGTVSISTVAICDYITKLAPEFPSVVKLSPRVVTARNAVDIIVGVRIKAGPQIHEVCELLQRRVRESMTNGLGISQVRRVEVSVSDIVSEHKPQ